MTHKLALKILTKWDLGFFGLPCHNDETAIQESIHLNFGVFRDVLYPSLRVSAGPRKISVMVRMYVPEAEEPINLQCTILGASTGTNWRLVLGENTKNQGVRFKGLEPGDLALLGFEGELVPEVVTMVLVSSRTKDHGSFFGRLMPALGKEKMVAIKECHLRTLCEKGLPVSRNHPVWRLVTDGMAGNADHEESSSDDDPEEKYRRHGKVGKIGEKLVASFLSSSGEQMGVSGYEWVSRKEDTASHDFCLRYQNGCGKLEVKSTKGGFGHRFFLSRGEIEDMASGDGCYRIARVYEITDDLSGAKMRISRNLRELGKKLLESCSSFGDGVEVYKLTVVPNGELFDDEIRLSPPHVGTD